jgi:uncharacterized protein (DUF1697 family)
MALVVFLRGCNVGGHRTFRPTLLAQQLKHYDVVNIGAAGTFVIRGRTSHARLRADLLRGLPFEAEVMICEGHDLIRVASANPFADEPIRSDIVRFVSVCDKRPRRLPSVPISLPAHGKWVLRILATEGRFLFGQYRRQMKAISYLGAIDRLFGVRVTTRNWNTIAAIIKVLGVPSRPNQTMPFRQAQGPELSDGQRTVDRPYA